MSGVYYNEWDSKKAAWLRELINKGLIADGEVDTRSIRDIGPADLAGYSQCHFFAGIGVWSYALRLAGWSDERPVWTGSCPCQPFSGAGQKKGVEDERHLWPEWNRLIATCKPGVVFGEQVASKDGLSWLDLVFDNLEGSDYAVRALDLCCAGFGAPHIRQRLYFVADADQTRLQGRGVGRDGPEQRPAGPSSMAGRLADANSAGLFSRIGDVPPMGHGHTVAPAGGNGRLAHADGGHSSAARIQRSGEHGLGPQDASPGDGHRWPGPVNGFWRDADWLRCRDAKWRPVEPGTFPLVDGAPARVGRLRGYGDAINAEVAAAFIGAFMDCPPPPSNPER